MEVDVQLPVQAATAVPPRWGVKHDRQAQNLSVVAGDGLER